jgi:hypothetical protein
MSAKTTGFVTTLLVITLAACSDVLSVSSSEGVTARNFWQGLLITNETEDSIGYTTMDAGIAARALWEPCIGPECVWLHVGEAEWVPAEEIHGWKESETLILYWWHARLEDGEFQPDSVRAIQVGYR